MSGRRSLASILLAGLVLAGCHDEARTQARSLVVAVERFQGTPNAQRPQAAADVARVPCTEASVTPACTACVAATRATGKALLLKQAVEKDLAAAEAGEILPAELAERHLDDKVQEAMKLLDEGREKMAACEQALTVLRREAHL